MLTTVPAGPLNGDMLVISGAGGAMKINPLNESAPPGVLTFTYPDEPPDTSALMEEEDSTVKDDAGIPPKRTSVASLKLAPVIIIVVPMVPVVGVKEITDGVGINVKPLMMAVPPAVVTETSPDAPEPTTALIVLSFITVKEAA